MRGRGYSKVLTIILVVIIVAIIGLLGYLGYSIYRNNATTAGASEYVDSFEKQLAQLEETSTNTSSNKSIEEPVNTTDYNNTSVETNTNTESTPTKKTSTYKGFEVLGTIEIPKTNVKYPILAKLSAKALDTAVCAIYPREVHLNTPGNVVIAGHNYRNGSFFSNNKRLTVGDKVNIIDLDGNKVVYTIYNKYQTSENDTKSYNKDTNGRREITLSTCTDDAKARIIIEARAD